METKISVRDCLLFGWEAFKKNPVVFIAAVVLINVFSFLSEYGGPILHLPAGTATDVIALCIGLLSGSVYIVVMVNLMLRAHDAPETIGYGDIFRPHNFLKLAAVTILEGLAVFVGLLALIVPGLILLASFSFAGYLAVEKGLNPWESLKESMRLSKGNRWRLLLLCLLSLGSIVPASIVAAFASKPISDLVQFVADILVLPISGIAFVHAYRLLEKAKTEESVAAGT